MEKKERFSLRKYKSGIVSVLIGTVFFAGASQVSADQLTTVSIAEETPSLLTKEVDGQTENRNQDKLTMSADQLTAEDLKELESILSADSSAEKEESVPLLDAPINKDTHDWTQVSGAWENGYKGQGKVIAIIDTGIDVNHQAMRISDISQAKFKTAEDMDQQKAKAKINYGKWINQKVIFAHNYVENNDKVKEVKFDFDFDFDIEDDSILDSIESTLVQSVDKKRYRVYPKSNSDKPKETVIQINPDDFSHIIDWPSHDDESQHESHGMHVTGIAVGNPLEASPIGERFLGVAPEAQVIFMRVFANDFMGTGEALYIKAIEDAVALGADAINLSLGGPNGSFLGGNASLMAAIEKAKKAGVSVIVAAGNERLFGSDHADPFASNPDYGIVNSPSTGKIPTSVAAIDNKIIIDRLMKVEGLENRADLDHGKALYTESIDYKKIKEVLSFDKDYDFIYINQPTDQAYIGKEVKGKIVLIERHLDHPYVELIANAKKHEVAGILIFNHIPGQSNRKMRLTSEGQVLPSAFISHEFGKAMSQLNGNGTGRLRFESKLSKASNQRSQQMNHFSSWGLTSDGYLKPDITAPGGDIYSTYNDNHYGSQTGTSMASPYIAGASLLLKQYIEAQHPDVKTEEMSDLVKYLLMSNASIHKDPKTQLTTSPRRQGAGLLNVQAAVTSGLYLTGSDNYGSISLGNLGEKISFDVTVHNLSNHAKKLRYVTDLMTDKVEDGRFTLSSVALKSYQGHLVDVPAKGQTTIRVSMDVSEFTKTLTKQMPNGYFLEGFVRFENATDSTKDKVNIPFVGFKGEFQNLAVVEESIYNLKAKGEKGFYFEESKTPDEIYVGKHYTGLVTIGADANVSTRTISDNGIHTLGTYRNKDGKFILEKDQSGNVVLAISPNGDKNQDFVAFKGVFLRKYKGLKASVYRADDHKRQQLLWTSQAHNGEKNYHSDIRFPQSTTLLSTEFSGRSLSGEDLPDGKYQYVVSYYPDVIGAKSQEMVFDVIVDREKPLLTSASFNPETREFKALDVHDRGQSGLLRDSVFYLEEKDGKPYTISINQGFKYVSVADNKVFVGKSKDGGFILPLDKANLADFYYMVEDFAGNIAIAKLGETLPEAFGKDIFTFTLKEGNYQNHHALEDKLQMTANDSGLMTNQSDIMITNRNRPLSRLVKANQSQLILSPNDNGNRDFIAFRGLPGQVYHDLKVTVFAADDKLMSSAIWTSPQKTTVGDLNTTRWDGKTQMGQKVLSGAYRYVITYRDASGMVKRQEHDILVSHEEPIITKASFQKDGDKEFFKPGKVLDLNQVGIAREEVFYVLEKEGRKYDIATVDDLVTISDRRVLIPRNADGSYTIPKVEGVTPADFYYLVEDMAGNIVYSSLLPMRSVGDGQGILDIALVYNNSIERPKVPFTYLVRDENGQAIDKLNYYDDRTQMLILPFGHYSLELLTYDHNVAELVSPKLFNLEISEQNAFVHHAFVIRKSEPAMVRVFFNQLLPEGSRVMLQAENGQLIDLDKSLYVPNAYGATVRDGRYTIMVTLPEGYHISGQTSIDALQNDLVESYLQLVSNGPSVSEGQNVAGSVAMLKEFLKNAIRQGEHKASQLPVTGEKQALLSLSSGVALLCLAPLSFFQKRYDKGE
ncbi:peptidase S8 [Streptococcus iniae]|uniref:S8 family serine peptidase n=1 Tax=Streptococcus iniae TaxID=1346 RepID=UPI000EF6463E|nr:S8 family serine peptidase [Streptococcus iniae]ELY5748609.1 S8 family serine peptidase [Streptococcus iniae]RLU59871.1 peptidase S8 [Streptococcus iniae]RLU61714.1 peptidase S8 [Streptococcus iniae]RLU70202.1 peptidase S8 [Streptococcus iniae]RLU84203.1 peptidase S8 [Streptococcus iniae]